MQAREHWIDWRLSGGPGANPLLDSQAVDEHRRLMEVANEQCPVRQ